MVRPAPNRVNTVASPREVVRCKPESAGEFHKDLERGRALTPLDMGEVSRGATRKGKITQRHTGASAGLTQPAPDIDRVV